MAHRFGSVPLLWMLLLVISCSASPSADDSPSTPSSEPTAQTLRDSMRDAAAGLSGVIVVHRDGRVVADVAAGEADRQRNVPTTTSTLYDIGSVAKEFTRAAVLVLQEADALALSDPISEYLPWVPKESAGITVQQLLTHRSGLPEYVAPTPDDFAPLTKREALASIFAQPLGFEPGTGQAYSNAGYTVLAAVVEAASGTSFTEFVARRVVAPTGAKIGFFGDRSWPMSRAAVGYGPDATGHRTPLDYPMTWALLGSGGMVSTAEDLARWFDASHSGAVVRPESIQRMRRMELPRAQRSQEPPPGVPERFAISAGGSSYGFNAVVAEDPDSRTYLVVLSNQFVPVGPQPAERAVHRLIKPVFGFEPPPLT